MVAEVTEAEAEAFMHGWSNAQQKTDGSSRINDFGYLVMEEVPQLKESH